MTNMFLRFCRRCREGYDIGTNFDICPKCRMKEIKRDGRYRINRCSEVL